MSPVTGKNVAGDGVKRRRWRALPSQVCIFGPNRDANRLQGTKSVAGQRYFADLRHLVPGPATPCARTGDALCLDLQHIMPGPATSKGSSLHNNGCFCVNKSLLGTALHRFGRFPVSSCPKGRALPVLRRFPVCTSRVCS